MIQDITKEIYDLEYLPVECDGFARLAAHVLTKADQDFLVHHGAVVLDDNRKIPLHFWIEWDGKIIDFRSKMWLKTGNDVPHGIMPIEEVQQYYHSEQVHTEGFGEMPEVLFQILALPIPADLMGGVCSKN